MRDQDPMLDIFIYESQQLLETLEDVLLEGEKVHSLNDEQVNEIFRIMHTIKGSASMMSFDNLALLAHAVEDLFSQIREKKARSNDWDNIFEIVLNAADYLKADTAKISLGEEPDSESSGLIEKIHKYLDLISHRIPAPETEDTAQIVLAGSEGAVDAFDLENSAFYKVKVFFTPDCQMENMRAFGIVNELNPHCSQIVHVPADLMANAASQEIVSNGFILYIQSSENPDNLKQLVDGVMFLKSASLILLSDDSDELPESMRPQQSAEAAAGEKDSTSLKPASEVSAKQNFISVNVNKLDKLLDLVGEIVTTESMVTKNPEIANLHIEGFERSSQQLHKLINELQDIVMSMRMLPVSATFHKMNRIVRDMSKKIGKEVDLQIIGEETEVDKNIIDSLSDPLMHLIRNAVDHGIETPEERREKGKPPVGRLTLEARNAGGDVIIIVADDGKGLDRTSIIKKAADKNLISKPDAEISDKEAYGLIFMPGFSTKENVTEFSGRGVGMDVVRRNIEKVGGSINIESALNEGTTITIRIPLTLAIIEGMKLQVGDLGFIIPMLSIQESFKANMKDVFLDPDGSEMIMIRGECYPIVRMHELFNITPRVRDLADGILIMINTESSSFCIFVDRLIGEQQAVVKPLPAYIQKHNDGMHGIGGCTILGDGSISLIVDINNLLVS